MPPAHQNLVHAVLMSQFHGCDRSINAPFKQSVLHPRAGYFLPVNRSHIELNMLGGCGFISFMLSRRFFAASVKCSCSVANMGFRSSLRRPRKDRLRPSVLLLAAVSVLSVPSPDDIANIRWISLTCDGWVTVCRRSGGGTKGIEEVEMYVSDDSSGSSVPMM